MKKNRITALLMSFAMCASFVPNAANAATAESDDYVTKVNFEEFEVGTAFTQPSYLKSYPSSNGKLYFEGADTEGNSASIATDPETGSKALKLERGTGKLNVWYVLDNSKTTGRYRVSMDVRFAVASGAYKKFAAVCDKDHSEIISPAMQTDRALTNAGKAEWWGVSYNDIGNNRARYEYIIDLDADTVNWQVVSGSTVMGRGMYPARNAGTSLEEIFMGIQNPANDTGYKGWEYSKDDNPTAVTYIDNIEVTECENTISVLDFDGMDEGTVTDTAINSKSGFYLERKTADSASIATDPKTGSKALKLTKAINNVDGDKLYFRYKFPEDITEKTAVSFDVRVAKATRYIETIGSLATANWEKAINPRLKGGTLCSGDKSYEFDYKAALGNDYATFYYVTDPQNKNVMLSIYNSDGKCVFNTSEGYTFGDNFSTIEFTMTANYPALGWEYNADADEDGEIYVDNIKCETYQFNPTAFSIKNGAQNVSKTEELYVSFNGVPDASALTADNFKLYKNGALMNEAEYEISAHGGNSVAVMPKKGFVYGENYTLTAEAGITSGAETTAKAATTSFSIEKYNDETVLENITFENYEEGTQFTENYTNKRQTNGAIQFGGLSAANTAKIVTDEATGSKALRMEKGSTGNVFEMWYQLDDEKTCGVYDLSYDLRIAKAAVSFRNMGMLTNSNWSNIFSSNLYGADSSMWYKNFDHWIGINYKDVGYAVVHYDYKVDLDNRKVTYKITTPESTKTDTVDFLSGTDTFGRFHFGMQLPTVQNAYPAWEYTEGEEVNGVAYLDNIKIIKKNAPEIVWTTPTDGAENVAVNSDITISTSVALDEDRVTKENIVLKDTAGNVPEYNVEVVGDKNIRISPVSALEENTRYTVEISGIKTIGNGGLTMTGKESFSFVTSGKYDLNIVGITDNAADSAKADITFEADNYNVSGGIDVIFASYAADGTLEDVHKCETIAVNKKYYATVTLKKNADIRAFAWTADGKNTPLGTAVPIDATGVRTYGIDNLKDGEGDITIAFLGGSITQQQQWITPLRKYFNDKYQGRTVNYVVAGVGGTGSNLQQYRVYNDIISKNPDLVFVDSTINDSQTNNSELTYENVMRKLLSANHQPAVISVAFGSKTLTTTEENWKAKFESYSAINAYYGVPYINVQKYAEDKIEDGTVSGWDAITADGTHPNAAGGNLYAECITTLLDGDYDAYVKKAVLPAAAMYTGLAQYENARELAWQDGLYQGTWQKGSTGSFAGGTAETSTDGDSVTVTFYGKAIALYTNCGVNGMNIDYDMDGGAKTGKISSFVNSWDFNQAGSTMAVAADEIGTHTVTFTARGTGKTDAKLVIGYFLVY